ncbi:hypothetical protein J437_LFUL003370, partial [Ladona fulva]
MYPCQKCRRERHCIARDPYLRLGTEGRHRFVGGTRDCPFAAHHVARLIDKHGHGWRRTWKEETHCADGQKWAAMRLRT